MTLPRILAHLALVTMLVFPATDVRAQEIVERPVVPEPGEEVRVVQRGARGAVHGLWVEATPDDVTISSIPGGGPIRIARTEITGMSVQRGERSRALTGALLGAGLGLVAGVIAGQTSDTFDGTGQAVGVSVAVGLPVGLLVGWLVRSPEWEGIDMNRIPAG